MDAQEEFDPTQMIIKGKRTKRRRPASPSQVPITSTSSSSCGGGGVDGGGGGDCNSVLYSSPAVSSEVYESSTEEEEDMANCLILLAQGNHSPKMERFSGRRFSDGAAGGIYVYQCKTCDRNFPSFQALGGHRASHKKPKPAPAEEKKPKFQHDSEEGKFLINNRSSSLFSLQIPNNKISKIHECSICGAEFSSGQALGGHMRRHRAATQAACAVVDSHDQAKKTRNVLPLDLNLPAPEDDDHDHDQFESKFVHQFVSTQPPPLVFSSPTLVDCHY